MTSFFTQNKCAIPLLFMITYGVPLIYLFTNYSPTLDFLSRVIALIAFLNVFAQVMLGSFRSFFKKHYHPAKVFRFHNYLGFMTLILGLIHVLIRGLISNNLINALLFNTSTSNNLGATALYVMIITVVSSDLKYFFNINCSTRAWRAIHLLNYVLFPLILFHAWNGVTLQNVIVLYFFISYLVLIILAGSYKMYDQLIK